MMTEEPLRQDGRVPASEAGALPRRRPEEPSPPPQEHAAPGDQYRIVTDLVAGPNLRWRDNVFQAAFIALSVATSVAVGAVLGGVEGAGIGGMAGLIGGLLVSGAALGIYRAVRHARGDHA